MLVSQRIELYWHTRRLEASIKNINDEKYVDNQII
jgi:hypothetical protein